MDDREDREDEMEQDNDSTNGTVGVTPSGMLAGNLTAGNPASGIMSGMVGGGPASGVAARQDVDDDQEGNLLNLDALDTLEGYGNADRDTGDEGVSRAQSELEAGEMNG